MNNFDLVKRLKALQKEFKLLYWGHGLIGVCEDRVHITPKLFDKLETQELLVRGESKPLKGYLRITGILEGEVSVVALRKLKEEEGT